MIVAQKWYCIAQTTSIGSSSGIKVEFGNYYRLLLNASVDWGNAVISIQFSNISKDIVASVRLRNNGQYFYLDIKLSKPFDTDFSTSLYDNSSWNLASSVSDLSGVPICIIDDINSLNTSQTGGESYLVEDENGDLHPIPKEDGTARGIYTDSFISSGGKNPNTEGGGGGGFTEFIIKFDDVEVNPEGYMSVDGVVTLPNYPSLDGYLLKDTADNLYQAKGNYATREELNALDKYIKSLFTAEYDENDALISIKANAGLWTNQYLSSGGKNANAGGEGGGVTSFDIMFEGDNVSRYPLENGVVILPAYPTMPDVSGFILKTTADTLYQPKGNYLTSIPSEYITETELSNALSPYLLSQTAADTYATIEALNSHIADYTTFKTNTNERLQSLEDMFEWDDDGHIHAKAGLYTDSFLSSGGKNTTEGTTGGGLTEFSVIFNGTQYDSSNGVATIDGTYATSDAVNNAIATSKSYTDTSIANLINGAPSTLDTLKEIADAMDANQDVVDALEEAIGTKASQSALDTLSGRVTTAESGISTNKTAIGTLQGYFTNGIAKEAAKVSNIFKIIFNGTTYEYNGSAAKEINFSATNIVSALGITPVNRAKGDESGNNIKSTYATKTALQEFIDKIEKYFTFGEDNIKANYGLWTDSYLSSGGQNTEGGSGGSLTSFSIVVNGTTYNSSNGVVTLPNYPTTLKNPYALTFGTKTYDGSAAKTITASDLGALTSHQTIYALAIKNSAGITQLTYNPNSATGSITLTKAMVGLGNVDNTSDSNKVVKAVIDYNDAARTVYIGYAGTGLTATNATHLAAYSALGDGRQVIKDISKANVQTWLGLGDLAYLSSISWNKITSDKPTTLAGYGITDKVAYREAVNNFIHHANEFTFAAPAYSGDIWMNYRTASGGLDGAITEYRFAKGAGYSYADIRAAKYIVDGGTSSQFLKANGSLDGTAYLPLSGGTITSTNNTILTLKGLATNAYSVVYFYNGDSARGYVGWRNTYGIGVYNAAKNCYLGIKDDATPIYHNGSSFNTLIHSGNIGSYALKNIGSASVDSARMSFGYDNSSQGSINLPTEGGFISVGQGTYGFQLLGHPLGSGLYYRGVYANELKSWKTIAFTDSNVASANILAKVYANENINYGRDSVAMRMIHGTASNSVSLGYPRQYVSGLSVITSYTGWQMVTYGGSTLPNPYFRKQVDDGSWLDWKQLAFLDDNVASATKLQTGGGVICATTDGSGNVTFNNEIYLGTNRSIRLANSSNTYQNVLFVQGTILQVGYDSPTINVGNGKLYINSSGNVGIGTDTPTSTLHVNGSFRAGSSILDNLTVYGSASLAAGYTHFTRTGNTSYNSGWFYGIAGNEAMAFINNAAASSFMFVQGKTAIENWNTDTWQSVTPALQIKQNCVAINYLWGQNVTPDYTLRVEGTAYFSSNLSAGGAITATGNITTQGRFYDSSDIRLKNIISDLSNLSLDTILSIPRVRYQWKKDNSMTMIGTIAQPLIGKFDELLHKDNEGMYSVDYDSISVIALEGVAKVKSEVDILRERINELEDKVKRLGGTV